MSQNYPLGRLVPTDDWHLAKYPMRAAAPAFTVERKLDINTDWRVKYDQGVEGACVGFAASLCMSILNRYFYDARWLYQAAQNVDEFEDTPPGEGTTVRAAMDVLRTIGHRRRLYQAGADASTGASYPPDLEHGILQNRWAWNVDQLRACIANGTPAVLGCRWYASFDDPVVVRTWRNLGRAEYWIGQDGARLGRVRGGHAITIYGASDRRQAFALCNSWGLRYPLVWIPYNTVQRLIDEDGEATVIVDRPALPKGDQ